MPICLDTEGAQIRTRISKRIFKYISRVRNFFNYEKYPNKLNLYPYNVNQQLKVGDIIYIDFNSVVVEITEIKKDSINVFVINGGSINTNKGVAVNRKLDLDPLTKKDFEAVKIAKRMKIKNFALSFCSKGKDVKKLRSLLGKLLK